MTCKIKKIAIIQLLSLAFLPFTATAGNYLEIVFLQYDGGSSGLFYDLDFDANKNGATTCGLTTQNGTFACIDTGDGWIPDSTYNNLGLTFAELTSEIGTDWTLTWDAGLATETIATIGFGTIAQSDWFAIPTITNPLDGTTGVSPSTSIDWTYSVSTASAQLDAVEVFLTTGNVSIESDELPQVDTSWTPDDPLAPGGWVVGISNGHSPRIVADGIGGPITGDPWVLENGDWLALDSVDRASFVVAGSAPGNALLPIDTSDGFLFEFGVVDITELVFVDPLFATGYEYIINSGPNFTSVLPPAGIGDNLYDLWLFDTLIMDYIDSGIDLIGGNAYSFATDGVDRFRIQGIETSALLDPTDVTAFVTGLTFLSPGTVEMRQIPITTDIDAESVPEPTAFFLFSIGLAVLVYHRRRTKGVRVVDVFCGRPYNHLMLINRMLYGSFTSFKSSWRASACCSTRQ